MCCLSPKEDGLRRTALGLNRKLAEVLKSIGVKCVVASLVDEKLDRTREATEILVQLKDEAVPLLLEVVEGDDEPARCRAKEALEQMGEPSGRR